MAKKGSNMRPMAGVPSSTSGPSMPSRMSAPVTGKGVGKGKMNPHSDMVSKSGGKKGGSYSC